MKKLTRHSLMAFAAALMLTACQGKPFQKLANFTEEATEATFEVMKSLDDDLGYREAQEKIAEATKSYAEKAKKIHKDLDGTEIETVATEETGLTIKKDFTVSLEEDDYETKLMLYAKAEIGEDAPTNHVSAIGYDGDTPVLILASEYYSDNDISINKEDGTVSFQLKTDASNAKQLGTVDKIVLTVDNELANKLYEEQRERKKEMWRDLAD